MRFVRLFVLLTIVGLCTACASFNVAAEKMVSQAITANEQLHTQHAISDAQFQATALKLNDVSVAGREYTKVQMAHTATAGDTAKFVSAISKAVSDLSAAPDGGKIAKVLSLLNDLEAKAIKYLNSAAGQ